MPGQEIDIHSVILKALETPTNGGKSNAQFPMILRFPDVLKNRLDSLHAAFKGAIDSLGYTSRYQGVFPIKVNQNKAVVHDLVAFGYDESYGLEAIAISCLTKAKPGAYLVYNGYKDADYIALALSARAMGLNTIIVLETEEELDIVIDQYEKLKLKLGDKVDFETVIGVRAKLLTKIPGHFGSTAGKHRKFGLLAETSYGVAKKLKMGDRLHWLKLLHFHVGSMIPTADIVYNAASEAAGMHLLRAGEHVGRGDDHPGLRRRARGRLRRDPVRQLRHVGGVRARTVRVAHPVLCTESGRAMASHHSMIILEALSAIKEPQDEDTSEQLLSKIQDLSSKHPGRATAAHNGGAAFEGIYSHAADLKKHGIEMYKLGKKLSKRVVGDANPIYNYHMNLSVFSLVPDFWGIKQLFPMMPVSRLDEKPSLNGTLVDITCDSDGKIEKFIGGSVSLPLHPLDPEHGGYWLLRGRAAVRGVPGGPVPQAQPLQWPDSRACQE
jgi:arginine decarboxylase